MHKPSLPNHNRSQTDLTIMLVYPSLAESKNVR